MLLLLFYVSVPTRVIRCVTLPLGIFVRLRNPPQPCCSCRSFVALLTWLLPFYTRWSKRLNIICVILVFFYNSYLLWESLDMWLCCPLLYIYWTIDNIPLTEWMYWDPLYIHCSSCFTVFSFEKMWFSCIPRSIKGACKDKMSE